MYGYVTHGSWVKRVMGQVAWPIVYSDAYAKFSLQARDLLLADLT
jgi:hypothetical protein